MPRPTPPLDSGEAGQTPLNELRSRHWEAYLALRDQLRQAQPGDQPRLRELLARLQEQQQAEEMSLTPPSFLRGDLPPASPKPHETNQET